MDDRDDRGGIVGVLLAGGRARRMGGGDKCLIEVDGRPVLETVIARARPQVASLVLNANGDPARFGAFGLPVVADVVPGHAGPLAGILTGFAWARAHRPGADLVASFATDTPFFPADLVARLAAARRDQGAELAMAASVGRAHPVFGLWPVGLADDLDHALVRDGITRIDRWTARHRVAVVEFATVGGLDPFFNLNEPSDLERLAALRCDAGGSGAP